MVCRIPYLSGSLFFLSHGLDFLNLKTNERFEYAGLSNGDECFCGNDFSQTIADVDDCNISCPGFSGQICGGFNRLR